MENERHPVDRDTFILLGARMSNVEKVTAAFERRMEKIEENDDTKYEALINKIDELKEQSDNRSMRFWRYLATAAGGFISSFLIEYLLMHIK